MVRRTYAQRSLVELLLPDGDKLWDPAELRADLSRLRHEVRFVPRFTL